jgi:hypothetical protein
LADGVAVRIFTARVWWSSDREDSKQIVSKQIVLISDWCMKHIGQRLPITAAKDWHMIELWDDRAVQVVWNTGRRADGLD